MHARGYPQRPRQRAQRLALVALADDVQLRRLGQLRERAQQDIHTFLAHQAPCKANDERLARCVRRWCERGFVHAKLRHERDRPAIPFRAPHGGGFGVADDQRVGVSQHVALHPSERRRVASVQVLPRKTHHRRTRPQARRRAHCKPSGEVMRLFVHVHKLRLQRTQHARERGIVVKVKVPAEAHGHNLQRIAARVRAFEHVAPPARRHERRERHIRLLGEQLTFALIRADHQRLGEQGYAHAMAARSHDHSISSSGSAAKM